MIIATYLVKDDSDILRDSIEFHLNNGVDALIVTENNSSLETMHILDSFKQYIIARINEPAIDYNQGKWVTRMARVAALQSPDWIFHCDADELWHGLNVLNDYDTYAIHTQCWRNYLPYSTDEFEINKAVFYEQPIEESWFGRGMQAKRKVIHKPDPEIEIHQGNHLIIGCGELPSCPITIHHYPIRTYEQFEQKAIVGGKAYEKSDLPEWMGNQWRKWYQEYKEGKLFKTYESFLATPNNIKEALQDGKIMGPMYV